MCSIKLRPTGDHQERTRILYVTDALISGGMERQLVELVSRLDRRRFDPNVLCLYGPRAGRRPHFLPDLELVGIQPNLLDLQYTTLDKVKAVYRIARHVWRSRSQVIHAINYHSNLLTRLARPLMPPSVKLLGSLRTQATRKQVFYERLGGWLSNAIVCNSPVLYDQLVQGAHIKPGKVWYIPNGVDLKRFRHNPDERLRQDMSPDARLILLTVGRISWQKSPHLLAEAVGLLKDQGELQTDVETWMLGESFQDDAQVALIDVINRYELADQVKQFGRTDQPEAFYHAADVVVLTSLFEGMPNTVLEALACGKPVVISEAANMAGLINDGVQGWVVKTGDVYDLTRALNTILNLSESELERMKEPCIARAQQYSIEAYVKRHEDLYDSTSGRLQS